MVAPRGSLEPVKELDLAAEARRTAACLRRFIRHRGVTERQLSRLLGFHPTSLSRVLRGRTRLGVRLLFEVLGVLGVRPAELYGELYDFADLLTRYPGQPRGLPTPEEMERFVSTQVRRVAGEPPAGELRRGQRPSSWERAAGVINVDYELERLCEELWSRIKRGGRTPREVSRRMGRHAGYLTRVLRQRLEPRVEDVLGVLATLGLWPDEFYEEYYGVRGPLAHLAHPEWRLTRGLPWGDAEDWFYDTRDDFRRAGLSAKEENAPDPPPGDGSEPLG